MNRRDFLTTGLMAGFALPSAREVRAAAEAREEVPTSASDTPFQETDRLVRSVQSRVERGMMKGEAAGIFDVKLAPIGAGDGPIAAMSIDKAFHGDLQGSSVGQMLAFRSGVEGSAGYVAMERVTATLEGRQGSFTLQHSGLMERGAQSLTVVVVPDSGTDGLSGLTGTMDIVVTPGRHDYRFRYTLPA